MKYIPQCIVATIVVFSFSSLTTAFPSSNTKSSIKSNQVEGRSLLDLLLSGTSESSAATAIKGITSLGEKNGLAELAQSLIGKDNGSTNLHVKILKLILNLFMDIMMDRRDVSKRREDFSPSPLKVTW